MKEAIVTAGPVVQIREGPIPTPNDDQVLIKVIVSGTNPKDWKAPEIAAQARPGDAVYEFLLPATAGFNQGDDIAGIIERVGANVVEFKVGDRVAAFHEMMTPHGSYAEYAIAPAHTTFHLPSNTSFEEASTIPLAALTAVISLYRHHAFPPPWTPATTTIPLVIYGASTAVGGFAIKLARASNIHPLIAIAGRGSAFVEGLLDASKGDTVIDYRDSADNIVAKIQSAAKASGHGEVQHAIDAAIVPESAHILSRAVAPGGQINFILPNDFDVSPAVKTVTSVGAAHNQATFGDDRDLAFVFSRYFTRALQLGTFTGHPFQVRDGGLWAVQQALADLKENKASATKYILRLSDTPLCK
ncbi:alcohol dehydrogenase [Phlyctema vagabunda]|uniref:Alcohol dehydrogenase n=1 Tax=Phlyctema vagabunda TaxID=108571 RepID=A0ABR4PWL9_9HELO